ncbi:MAG: S26 family signal peptidase [Thermoproteota archaeon]|nr:S26 family signal peptidase [Thermoproteota archaeon]
MTPIKQWLLFTYAALALGSLMLLPSSLSGQVPSANSSFVVTGNMLPILHSIFVVKSNNMLPLLRQYDVVFVNNHFPFHNLTIGDIIAFKTFGTTVSGQHEIIISRVAQTVTDNHGDRIIRTKGDANADSIPSLDYPILQQNYIGKVVYRLGNIVDNTSNSVGSIR